SDELEDRFEELTGLRLSELYGMTEALDIAITPSGGPNKKGSAGPLGPGVEASVRDADGTELGPGEEGRLWVRYAGNTIGYWRRPNATNEVLVDGWLDTGDVVRFDDDGYLWFRGRRKQIIVHDGSNIAPQEVEAALVAHPAVARAGVVGVDDVRHGENVWAFVTFHPDTATPTQDDLIAFARERVGYKAPDVIIALDTMPVTAVGKTDRTTLKRIAADKHATEAVL
ncbi:MAG: AMP-binding protein, partial [Pseudomonadota bacterium]